MVAKRSASIFEQRKLSTQKQIKLTDILPVRTGPAHSPSKNGTALSRSIFVVQERKQSSCTEMKVKVKPVVAQVAKDSQPTIKTFSKLRGKEISSNQSGDADYLNSIGQRVEQIKIERRQQTGTSNRSSIVNSANMPNRLLPQLHQRAHDNTT